MKRTKLSVEPFLRYPESLIDSKEKAIRVIKTNCYYFYVVGVFAIVLGSYIAYSNVQSREDFIFGIFTVITGTLYIVLPFLIYLFKSRFVCFILILFMTYSMVEDIYLNGLNAVGIFKFVLVLALYRMTKAVFYYNT